MPVPTVTWWRKKTTGHIADRKNPLITDVDILLMEYHASGKTDIQRQKILILILYYCTTWLVAKGEKKGSWRRKYVLDLQTEVENELRTPTMINAGGQRIAGNGGVYMKEDPIEILQPRDANAKHNLRAGLNFGRHSANVAEDFIGNLKMKKNLTGYMAELQQEMKSGTGAHDYVDSLKILAAGKAANMRMGYNLTYLSKQERLSRQLSLWPDDAFHLAGWDFPYQTAGGPDDHNIFAMDLMEFIYVADGLAGRVHHSSFMSGKPVLCAGEIRLEAGKIRYISNESGHYRPTTANLMNCVTVLVRKYNVDLSRIKLGDQEAKHEWDSAADFMARGGVPPRRGRIMLNRNRQSA
ncbi:MAG: hypothetical protein GC160_19930 [Acidobacteria bacterium]|nr:hypothetical protein [Acidobacteriota bacterium]